MRKSKLNNAQKVAITISTTTVGFIALNLIVASSIAPAIYKAQFKKVNRPDYELKAGLVNYERIDQSKYKRTSLKIDLGNEESLVGYYYDSIVPSNDLIVFSHGIRSGADDYLSLLTAFIDKGYNVLAFDSTGTYESSGSSLGGFPQMTIDLERVLTFVDNLTMEDANRLGNSNLAKIKTMDKYLMGHSWGAYASCAVLNFYDAKKGNVKAVASISGSNSAEETVVSFAKRHVGFLATMSKDFVNSYQVHHFKKYALATAVDGLNTSKVPAFIANGENDDVFPIDDISTYSYTNRLKCKDNIYYLAKQENGGHMSILYSKDALLYQSKVARFMNYPGITLEEQKAYMKNVFKENAKYSEVNPDLVNNIHTFFQKF